jgi:hypothetical protein
LMAIKEYFKGKTYIRQIHTSLKLFAKGKVYPS